MKGSTSNLRPYKPIPPDAPRRPLSEIPPDLTCRMCEPARAFNAIGGFKGHMRQSHDVLYELQDTSERPAPWRLDNYSYVPVEPQDLPGWAKLALVRHELLGLSFAEIARDMGKEPATLQKLAATQAGIKAIAEIKKHTSITSIVQALLQASQLDMFTDWMMALQWAKEKRDPKLVHQMIKEIGLQPVLKEVEQEHAPPTIVLNLGTSDLSPLQYSTSHRPMIAEIVDDDDDDATR